MFRKAGDDLFESPNRIYTGLLRYCRVMDSDSESEFSDQERLIVHPYS